MDKLKSALGGLDTEKTLTGSGKLAQPPIELPGEDNSIYNEMPVVCWSHN